MKKMIIFTMALASTAVLTAKARGANCHGEDGKGQTKIGLSMGAEDFTDAKVRAEMRED